MGILDNQGINFRPRPDPISLQPDWFDRIIHDGICSISIMQHWFQIDRHLSLQTIGGNSAAGVFPISAETRRPSRRILPCSTSPIREGGYWYEDNSRIDSHHRATGIIILPHTFHHRVIITGRLLVGDHSTSTGRIPEQAGTQSPVGCAIKTGWQQAPPPDPSAMMDVSATDKGCSSQEWTSAQRDAILPVAGLAIYNSLQIPSNILMGPDGTAVNCEFCVWPIPPGGFPWRDRSTTRCRSEPNAGWPKPEYGSMTETKPDCTS